MSSCFGLLASILCVVAVHAGAATNRFEREVQGLERRLRAAPPEPGSVVLYGSSSFRTWTNVSAAFPGHRIVNLGFGGSHVEDLLEFFDRLVVPLKPRLVLVYGGDNDVAAGKTPARVEAECRELVRRFRRELPGTRVAFLAVKPSPSRQKWLSAQRETNARLRRLARGWRRVDFLDVARPLEDARGEVDSRWFLGDRLHLNAEGYARWRVVLGPYLDRWGRG